MRSRLLAGIAFLGLLCAMPGQVWSGGDKEKDLKEWMEKYGTPGPEHKHLEALHGKFDVSVKMYMPGEKEPNTSKGHAERKWLMDKRYLEEHMKGDFMGKEFKGMGLQGYDRLKKKYVFTWIDNFGTGITYAEGDYDAKAKTITYSYVEDSPFTGKNTKAKDVIKIISDDVNTLTMYRTPAEAAAEVKTMEITYTRQVKGKD